MIQHSQWHSLNAEQAELTGVLDRESVPALWSSLKQWQPSQSSIEISLQSVSRIDSAGMVMLIHLLEHAKKRNCHIMLSFVPQQLATLLKLSNVDSYVAGHLKN